MSESNGPPPAGVRGERKPGRKDSSKRSELKRPRNADSGPVESGEAVLVQLGLPPVRKALEAPLPPEYYSTGLVLFLADRTLVLEVKCGAM